ncbi:MAG: GFA family protein [Kangiellaceae bacterium]|nr:GFA family protein [Kangiellaceae bacterium]
MPTNKTVSISGGCHCGNVRFTATVNKQLDVINCNCSICRMTGYQHIIVRRKDFELDSGEAALSCYQFNTQVAKHYFCHNCGIKSFYIPRSNPDGVSINANCVDDLSMCRVTESGFDGVHWEDNAEDLKHLT